VYLGRVGIPLPSLPLGIQMANPEIVFEDGYVIVETDLIFPFPRTNFDRIDVGGERVKMRE
jgi:hypothetical protein